MIYGSIDDIEKYASDKKLYAVLTALKQHVKGEDYDVYSIASICEIEGDTRFQADAQMENHHQYVDIHYVLEGKEKILVSSRKDLERLTEFSDEKDCELFVIPNDVENVELKRGDFLVVYPGESHAPMIAKDDKIEKICKLVVKYQ